MSDVMGKGKRLLVTGSPDWTDYRALARALGAVWREWGKPDDAVLIEGECPYSGAAEIAASYWRIVLGLPVEPFPAERDRNGRILDPEHNQRMVDSGADLCLAAPLPGSRDTWDCVKRAEAAGIEVRVIKP